MVSVFFNYTKSNSKNMPEFVAVRFYSKSLSRLEVHVSKNLLYTYRHANPGSFIYIYAFGMIARQKKYMKLY